MAMAFFASCGTEDDSVETQVSKQLLNSDEEINRDSGKMAPDPETIFSYHKKTGEAGFETKEGALDLDSWHNASRPYDRRAHNSGFAWEEVELMNGVIADSSLMTNTFCYYAGVNDREE